jgi:hypothetical protein
MVVAVATLLALALALPAAAHETDPSIVAELLAITPEPPEGVTIQVATSIEAQLIAENTTDRELVVLARGGEPFLRIGPDGVLANLNSPDWYRTNDPTGAATVPARAQDPDAEPEWARASREPSWGWFDHRLHDAPLTAADVDVEEGRISDWEIPMTYGGEPLAVTGQIARRPIRGAVVAALESDLAIAEDLTLALLPGPLPGLFIDSARTDDVIVTGPEGEPFLRVGPDGVEANVRSPAWAENAAARGQVPEAEVDPRAAPEWVTVADVPRYGWLEPRARPAADPPPEVTQGGRVVVLGRWEVPLEVGGRAVVARGVTTWQPTSGEGAPADAGLPGAARLGVLGLAAAGVLGLGLLARARSRRGRSA